MQVCDPAPSGPLQWRNDCKSIINCEFPFHFWNWFLRDLYCGSLMPTLASLALKVRLRQGEGRLSCMISQSSRRKCSIVDFCFNTFEPNPFTSENKLNQSCDRDFGTKKCFFNYRLLSLSLVCINSGWWLFKNTLSQLSPHKRRSSTNTQLTRLRHGETRLYS